MVGDSDSSPPPSVIIGDSDSSPPPSVIIEDSAAPIQNVFSASVSTENITFTDLSLAMPVKGKMMKKQFFLGLFGPILVISLFSIGIESMSEDDYGEGSFKPNEEGEISIDMLELGFDCTDGYPEASLSWNTETGYGRMNVNYYCDGALKYWGSENIGTIHENGSIELDLSHPPANGYAVEFRYWKDNLSRTESLGQGDGVNTTFSGNIDPDYCEGQGEYEYEGQHGRYAVSSFQPEWGVERPCTIFEEGEFTIDSKFEDGVLTFKLPESSSNGTEINVEVYSYDSSMDFFYDVLPFLGCLGIIGAVVGAYMSGYKWFAYGVGASIIVIPALLFILAIALLMAYGF